MVAPRRLVVLRGVVDLRAAPSDDAELVDQLHHGEGCAILERRAGRAFVQADDHYFGWIPEGAAAADATAHGDARVIAIPLADVHERPDPASPVVDRLPAGTWLPKHPRIDRARVPVGGAGTGWVWLPVGWVPLDATVLYSELPHRPPTAEDLIATARAFLGVPYLWGGTTALGLDCSGFVQQVYRLNGIRLDRDADQQATEGRSVDVPRAGDLIFFGAERITHVALASGERTCFHAPEGGVVEHVDLSRVLAKRVLGPTRRYLPG